MQPVWYDIPGFPGWTVSSDAQFRSFTGKPVKKTYKKRLQGRGRAKLNLSVDGVRYTKCVARLVLSAKLGRELEPWEDCCHIDGDPTNDHMDNLKVACRLNNIIDELEMGRIQSSPDLIKLAISRLEVYLREHSE